MITAVFVAVGGVVGALFTYLVARRQRSGRIDTTEAATLWAESNAMRQEYRGEVIDLRSQLNDRHSEIVDLKERDLDCRRQLTSMQRRVRRLEQKSAKA